MFRLIIHPNKNLQQLLLEKLATRQLHHQLKYDIIDLLLKISSSQRDMDDLLHDCFFMVEE